MNKSWREFSMVRFTRFRTTTWDELKWACRCSPVRPTSSRNITVRGLKENKSWFWFRVRALSKYYTPTVVRYGILGALLTPSGREVVLQQLRLRGRKTIWRWCRADLVHSRYLRRLRQVRRSPVWLMSILLFFAGCVWSSHIVRHKKRLSRIVLVEELKRSPQTTRICLKNHGESLHISL